MCATPEAQRNWRHARLKLRADLKPRTKPAPRATSDSRASPTPCASRKGARRGQDRPAWPGPRFRRSTARPIEKSALHSRRRVRRWRAESAPGVPAGICGETCASAWPGTRPSPCMRQRAPLHAGVERSCCARTSPTPSTDRTSLRRTPSAFIEATAPIGPRRLRRRRHCG